MTPTHRGEDFDQADLDFEFDYLDEIKALILAKISAHERSQQTALGASELGIACHRKFAYTLAKVPPAQDRDGPESQWRQTVGTAVHIWLAEMLEAVNARELKSPMHSTFATKGSNGAPCKAPWCPGAAAGHLPRFAVELTVAVGTIDGEVIYGHIDVYDRMRFCVVDWKIVGPKSLKDKHAGGPGRQNVVQGMVYAGGKIAEGQRVDRVVLVYLPMNGELRDAFVWSKPYDPAIRKRAFERARDLDAAIKDEGIDALAPRLGTVNDYCHRCPWFAPGEPVSGTSCPGDKSILAGREEHDSFEGLM